jgi:hypothetical protein
MPACPDLLFVAGRDWQYVDALSVSPGVPVINLIQGVRHGLTSDARYQFLRRKAVRICVSPEVAYAIQRTGIVNGPAFVVPAAIDLGSLSEVPRVKPSSHEILIGAVKQPALGRALAAKLREQRAACSITLLTDFRPRMEFLEALANCRVAVLLPEYMEGFYLPAIEAMALGALLVCPDCVGNRTFCLHERNCLRPDYDLESITACALRALDMPAADRDQMLACSAETARPHDLASERAAFLDILHNLKQLW